MAFAFDTLGYAKRLRAGGIPQDQAEAHAEAAQEFIMTELATRHDLEVLRRELQTALDHQSLRLTVRTGVMLAASIAVLATIIQLS